MLFGSGLWEVNAQPKLFPRDFYQTWDEPPTDFSLDLYSYVMAKRQNLALKTIDVVFPERIHGHSSWNTSFKAKMRVILRTLSYAWKLRKNI